MSIIEQKQKTKTEKIDSILMHKFFGLPIFLLLMWSLFQLTFTLGEIPMGFIENISNSLIEHIKIF